MRLKTLSQISLLLAAAPFLAAATVLPAYAGPGPTGSGPAWATLAPVPSTGGPGVGGVEGMSVAAVGDEIIAALGHDPLVADTDVTRIYDIASDTWSFGANAPDISSEGAGVAHGGLFYNIGGRDSLTTPTGARDDIWAYDPASDTWNAALTPMITPRAGLAVAVVGNAIYAIGGRLATGGPCNGLPLARVEVYDIASDTWTPVAPLPSPRSDLAATTIGGKIYVFGGCDDAGTILADVDVYNPVTDTWSTAPTDMPTARAAMYAVASKGGSVYVIGGWDGLGIGLSTNEAYKVAQDAWTVGLLAMPTPRAETGAVGHGGRIYILGGAQPAFGASVDENEVFKP